MNSPLSWGAIALGALVGGSVAPAIFPARPFMTVHSMTVAGDMVEANRTIHVPTGWADWFVAIAPQNEGPVVCYTIPGESINQGWSRYQQSEAAVQSFPINDWVGDDDCQESLTPGGEYSMFVTWTPRDGSPTVSASTDFTYIGQ